MKKIIAFIQLIRVKNLFFIALTQLFFYGCIIRPSYQKFLNNAPYLSHDLFLWMVFASVLIASGGYIINDYFDLNIDKINKPQKIIIDKEISRRWAMMLHFFMSIAGMVITGYVSIHLNNFLLMLLNGLAVILLWVYSTTFKKKLLSGNVIISVLTAWVIFMLFFAEFYWQDGRLIPTTNLAFIFIYKLAIVYGGFAFIVSLIREVIKDIEDESGDRKYGCKTMPIAWGVHASKVFVSVWMVALFGALCAIMIFTLLNKWYLVSIYTLLLLGIILRMFSHLKNAKMIDDYTALSKQLKLLMLAGIFSMVLFYFYF